MLDFVTWEVGYGILCADLMWTQETSLSADSTTERIMVCSALQGRMMEHVSFIQGALHK